VLKSFVVRHMPIDIGCNIISDSFIVHFQLSFSTERNCNVFFCLAGSQDADAIWSNNVRRPLLSEHSSSPSTTT
jgi:hypothetical protein